MNLKIKISLLLGISFLGLSSCKDFLDIKPKGELIPEKLNDYNLMFNGGSMTNLIPAIMEVPSDNYYNGISNTAISTTGNLYFWRKYLDDNVELTPLIWLNSYKTIYYCNYIVANVMTATDGTETQKKELLAQAKTIRATSYFVLATVFANAYDPAKNAGDLGLPIVTSTNVTEKTPARSTLKETVDYLILDLESALNDLPLQQNDRWRVTKYAAAGMLSRVYLYIHNYQKSSEYAGIALQSTAPNQIIDYNTLPGKDNFPKPAFNTEKLWLDYQSIASSEYYTRQLAGLYTTDDLRLKMFASKTSSGMYYRSGYSANGGVSFAEMHLNQAEYLARNNQGNQAMDIINMIRKKRLPATSDNLVLTAGTPQEALTLVLQERRRELAFSGVRWMDMKRLDQEDKMPVVFRYMNNDPAGTVIGELKPGSKSYTFEIPLKVQNMNPGIKLNY